MQVQTKKKMFFKKKKKSKMIWDYCNQFPLADNLRLSDHFSFPLFSLFTSTTKIECSSRCRSQQSPPKKENQAINQSQLVSFPKLSEKKLGKSSTFPCSFFDRSHRQKIYGFLFSKDQKDLEKRATMLLRVSFLYIVLPLKSVSNENFLF